MNGLKRISQAVNRSKDKPRFRYNLRSELILVALPTFTIMLVLLLVEKFTQQRILFASLASSAFLIYRDPHNQMNSIYSLLISQTGGSVFGLISYFIFGDGLWAASIAMIATILFIVSLNAIHPPAISTAISFGFRAPSSDVFSLFLLALIMVVVLLILEQAIMWTVSRIESKKF